TGARGRGRVVPGRSARRRRVLLRRHGGGPARRLRARAHRRPGREREQRLRVGVDGAHGGARRGRRGDGGLRPGDRVREGGPVHSVHRPRLPARSSYGGDGGELIDSGATTYGGRWVVTPSGGLIS